MNKNLLILPAMVLTMGLASCARNVSRVQALNFVKQNYKNTEWKTSNSMTITWDFNSSKGDTAQYIAKEIIKSLTDGTSDALKGSYESKDEYSVPPLNEETFEYVDESASFSIKGKELTIKYETDSKSTYKISVEDVHNSDGYRYLKKIKYENIKIDNDNLFAGNYQFKCNI